MILKQIPQEDYLSIAVENLSFTISLTRRAGTQAGSLAHVEQSRHIQIHLDIINIRDLALMIYPFIYIYMLAIPEVPGVARGILKISNFEKKIDFY